jgi:hypothetical protein
MSIGHDKGIQTEKIVGLLTSASHRRPVEPHIGHGPHAGQVHRDADA